MPEAIDVRREMYGSEEFSYSLAERLNYPLDRVKLPLDALRRAKVIPSELDDNTEALRVEATKIVLAIASQVRKPEAIPTVVERFGAMTLQAEPGKPRTKLSTDGFFAADLANLLQKYWQLAHGYRMLALKERVANAMEAVVELDQPHHIAAAIHYLQNEAAPAIEGNGGEFRTMLTAMSLRDLGISEEYALGLMLDYYNEQKCDPPWGFDGLKQKVANGYQYASLRPIGGGTAEADFAGDAVEPFEREPEDKFTVVNGTKIEVVRTPRAPRKKKRTSEGERP
jgi:hypothetical protein